MVTEELSQLVTSLLRTQWVGTCDVSRFVHYTDPVTKETKQIKLVVLKDEPCRLSYPSAKSAVITDTVTTIEQQPVLFLRCDAKIPAGSDITVTQNGRVMRFTTSGEPRVYSTHQEIAVTLSKETA